jgi:hypothetical protein
MKIQKGWGDNPKGMVTKAIISQTKMKKYPHPTSA